MTARAPVFGVDEQAEIDVDLDRFVRLATLVLDEERVAADAQLSILFVDERAIADLNRRFAGHDDATDVLAFPIDGEPRRTGRRPDEGGRGPGAAAEVDEPPFVLGDVVVCPRVAQRQAQERGHDTESEIDLLVVHGTLHLLDYDHADPDEEQAMRRREREILTRFHDLQKGA